MVSQRTPLPIFITISLLGVLLKRHVECTSGHHRPAYSHVHPLPQHARRMQSAGENLSEARIVSPAQLSAQSSGVYRSLLQETGRRSDSSANGDSCFLTKKQVDRSLDGDTRTWHVDETILDELNDDLQAIVDCTQEGDTLQIQSSRTIRPMTTIVIPWSLKISAESENTDPLDGESPKSQKRIVLTCPDDDQGIFLVRGRRVLFVNIDIEKCALRSDEKPRFIIEIEGCQKEHARQIVKLRHVRFSQNQLEDAAAFGTQRPSCSEIELTDVEFTNNRCSGVCGAALANENRLQDVRLLSNRPTDSAKRLSILLSLPPKSQTVVDAIKATDNKDVILLHANASTVSLSNSVFSDNLMKNVGNMRQMPTCIRLEDKCNVDVRHSLFEKNKGESGVVFYTTRSDLSLTNCTFRENTARENGSAVLGEKSNLQGNALYLIGNSASNSGGCFALETDSRMNISDSTWVGNHAAQGGAVHLAWDSIGTLTRCTFRQNSAIGRGGSVNTQNASLIVHHSLFKDGEAYEGGFVVVMSAELKMISTVFRNGTANTGGAVRFKMEGNFTMRNITFAHNSASYEGGALYVYGANVTSNQLRMEANNAIKRGGAMFSGISTLYFTRSVLRGNSADYGGAIILLSHSNGTFVGVKAVQNHALSGGSFWVGGPYAVIRNASFHRNIAKYGGSISIYGSIATLNVSDSKFQKGSATYGGFIWGNDPAWIFLQRISMTGGKGSMGGGVRLAKGTNLWAQNLWISNSRAEENGGAVSINDSSIFSCRDCVFENNAAGIEGGGLYFASSLFLANAVLLRQCILQNNNADYGGGLYFLVDNATMNCAKPDFECPFVRLTETVFSKNRATYAGGGMFVSDVDAVHVNCSALDGDVPRGKQSDGVIRSSSDFCPSWQDNRAGVYGPVVGSFAKLVKKTVVNEDTEEVTEFTSNSYQVLNHENGRTLPKIGLLPEDVLGQGPAIGVNNGSSIVMAISSPDGFLRGTSIVPVIGGTGILSNITGFVPKGNYSIHVEFRGGRIEDFVISIHLRGCPMGKALTANGTVCTPCDEGTYNFFPDANEGCRPCPENGDCGSSVIAPRRGYWHPNPCSAHIQRCLADQACDVENRERIISDLTNGVESCEFNASFAKNYSTAQCREGHEGPLCGSCHASYGKTRLMECVPCLDDDGNALMLIVSLLVLLALSSFTVRSGIPSVIRTNASSGTIATVRSSNSVNSVASLPEGLGMMSLYCLGRVPKSTHESIPQCASVQQASAEESELAKWKAAELFKICVNYLQVTAIAISLNVDWTLAIITLFEAAQLLGGLTSGAVNRSVDCLVSDGASMERPIAGVLMDLSLPLATILIFMLAWSLAKIKHGKGVTFLVKRISLSAIAVLYISYISLSKTLANVLNCIEVHTAEDLFADGTAYYWAVDTGIRCYEGSHAVLVATIGLPFLVIFSVGFPAVVALTIFGQVKGDYKEGWIYDVASFMYRSYKRQYRFWESIVMLRKALLAGVVVFSYQLGANLQQVLSVFVLSLALYLQMFCRPFREEFDVLNDMESASLLVSLLTFVSSLFFHDDVVSEPYRVVITVFICISNLVLFYTFVSFFCIMGAKYLTSVLDREGIEYRQDGGTLHITRVYLFVYLSRLACNAIARAFRCKSDEAEATSAVC